MNKLNSSRKIASVTMIAVFGFLASGAHAMKEDSVDAASLIIYNARIWTGKPGADWRHGPSAIAVRGDRIIAIGDDAAVRALTSGITKVIDAAGRRLIPGLTDSHTHMISGGFQLDRLNLRGVRSRDEFVAAIAEAARSRKKGEWLLGGRWSVESWSNPESPHRSWLDAVAPETPIFLNRMDGHQALVNTAALRIAGIDVHGPADPTGGEIERDPKTREPTGVLKESAMELVQRHVPPASDDERYAALLRAMKHANELGLTSVHDMSEPEDIPIFERAAEERSLTVRVTSYVQTSNWAEDTAKAKSLREKHDRPGTMFTVAGFKGYMDGSLGSRTAYMREPYCDASPGMLHPRGQLTAFAGNGDGFRAAVAGVDAAGLQIAVHAIGDEGNHLLLDAYEAAAKASKRTGAHHRVEHAQHLMVDDIPRFARLGVVASMQPYHKADDGRYAEKAICRERLNGSYAYRQLLDAGALLCFGSDWPVVTLNPFAGMDAAVNSKTLAGDVWLPQSAVTVEDALRAYTASPAQAVHREKELGTLEVGKLADFVLLEEDPLTVPQSGLGDVQARLTVCGGKIVFERHPTR